MCLFPKSAVRSSMFIKRVGVSRRSRAEPSNLSAGGDSLMGSGSEDEDEDGSAHHHHHDPIVRGTAHLGPHNIGPSGPGDQTAGHGGELPLGGDPCKQEDSEDQGKSLVFLLREHDRLCERMFHSLLFLIYLIIK